MLQTFHLNFQKLGLKSFMNHIPEYYLQKVIFLPVHYSFHYSFYISLNGAFHLFVLHVSVHHISFYQCFLLTLSQSVFFTFPLLLSHFFPISPFSSFLLLYLFIFFQDLELHNQSCNQCTMNNYDIWYQKVASNVFWEVISIMITKNMT